MGFGGASAVLGGTYCAAAGAARAGAGPAAPGEVVAWIGSGGMTNGTPLVRGAAPGLVVKAGALITGVMGTGARPLATMAALTGLDRAASMSGARGTGLWNVCPAAAGTAIGAAGAAGAGMAGAGAAPMAGGAAGAALGRASRYSLNSDRSCGGRFTPRLAVLVLVGLSMACLGSSRHSGDRLPDGQTLAGVIRPGSGLPACSSRTARRRPCPRRPWRWPPRVRRPSWPAPPPSARS